jgi:hypothetical protein
MATITTTNRVDDLNGLNADITVGITVDSKRYSVDLSKGNYNEYIAPLVKAARPSKVGRPPRQTSKARSAGNTVRKRSLKPTAYSRLTVRDQTAIRGYLKRIRGRVSDSDVTTWKSARKP